MGDFSQNENEQAQAEHFSGNTHVREWNQRWNALHELRLSVHHINCLFKTTGTESGDGMPVVREQGIGSSRVNVPIHVLEHLVACALQTVGECNECRKIDMLAADVRCPGGHLKLCVSCRLKLKE